MILLPLRNRMSLAAVCLLAALPLALGAFASGQAGGKRMEETRFFRFGRSTVITPDLREIRLAPASAIPAAQASGSGYVCPWANQQQDSRSPHPLPQGEWRLRWRAEWGPQGAPAFVLQQNDRIFVRGLEWRLMDMQGRTIFSGAGGGGPVVLDAAQSLFYRIVSGGDLAAARLSDGKPHFLHLPSRGDVFARTLIARRGDRILVGGNERQLDSSGSHPARESLLEIVDVPEPVETTELGTLTSGTVNGILQIPSPRVLFAASADTIVAAAPDRIYIIDWDLKIRHALKATFEPVLMSLDEAGRIYLIVKVDTRQSLWLLTQEGGRLYSFDSPPGVPDPKAPPIIAYDHGVYLLAGEQILSLGADGKLNWIRATSGTIGGAITTPDGRLIVSEGDRVTAWDAKAERCVLFASGGDPFRTPPVLTGSGELLVASSTSLYCLAAAPGRKQ